MGKFKIIVSAEAQKDLQAIHRSGDKASIKKLTKIFTELETHPENGTVNPKD